MLNRAAAGTTACSAPVPGCSTGAALEPPPARPAARRRMCASLERAKSSCAAAATPGVAARHVATAAASSSKMLPARAAGPILPANCKGSWLRWVKWRPRASMTGER
jgi:hypothetical protein